MALNNVIQIALDGSAISGTVNGLDLIHGATVTGLAIHSWSGAGIRMTTSANGRPMNILGNYLGTDSSGQVARGNLVGIELRPNARVTGTSLSWVIGAGIGGGNLISGNRAHGVMVVGGEPGPTAGGISANRIGLARDGSALGNGAYGLSISTPSNNLVHAFFTSGNYIGANIGGGVQIISSQTSPDGINLPVIRFLSDQIGIADGELRPNLGHAISIGEGSVGVGKVHFSSVSIGHDAGPAVRILGAQTEVIISALGLPADGVPIDIGPAGATPNDPGDLDNGPNRLLNTPVLLSALFNDRGDRLRVSYQVDSPQDAGLTVKFYRRIEERLEFVGEHRYPGGIATAELEASNRFLTGRLAVGSEIVAQTVLTGIASSELTPMPIVVEARQALVSTTPVLEGNGAIARFVIGLEPLGSSSTTLDYRTIDGSARSQGAIRDYFARSGSVTLTPAEPTAIVDVPLANDGLVEQDETFDLEVYSATNFAIGSGVASAVILDDDRLRQDRGEYDPLDLDSLNGIEGFRIEHPRMPETSLVALGNFDGSAGTDLLLAQATSTALTGNPSSLYLMPNLSAPFQPSYVIPASGSAQFPRIVDTAERGAGYLAGAAGRLRDVGQLPSLLLRNGDRLVVVHGRTTALAASTNLAALSSTETISGSTFRVTPLGDINGDGRMDFAVDSSATGSISAAVIFGSLGPMPSNLGALNGTNGFTITNLTQAQLGAIIAIRSIGDINNDGRADLLVRGRTGAGVRRDALILGQAAFASQVFFDQINPMRALGTSDSNDIETASGDLNGDGHLDVVIATPNPGNGAALSTFIIFGSGNFNGINSAANITEVRQGFPGDQLGSGLAVMDLNGNRISDLALGAAGADQGGTRAGRVAVLYGRSTWPAAIDLSSPPPQTVKFLSTRAGAGVGHRLAAIGDMNGDGRGELAITAPTVGRSYIYFSHNSIFSAGGEAAPPPPPVRQVYSTRDGSPGEIRIDGRKEVLPAGDVDGDGRPDVLFGMPEPLSLCPKAGSCAAGIELLRSTGAQTGAELLLPGAVLNAHSSIVPTAPPSGTTRIRRADKPNEPLTGKYAGVGDFNGDGRADLAFLSAAGGFVAVVAGRATLPAFIDPQADAQARSRRYALDATDGLRVAGLGDIDGDGFADLGVLRGAPSAPRIEIIYGIASGTPRRTQITAPAGLQPITLARTPRLGRIRTGAVPADSFEVILGDGQRAVVFGTAALPGTLDLGNLGAAGMYVSAAHRLPANAATLAALGDIDGDGIADFGIAHSPLAIDGSGQGRIEILRGRASWPASLDVGTSDPALIAGRIVLRGEGVGSINGLDALRDRNADGRRELLISLGLAEGHATQSGKAFIVHGPALPTGQQTVLEFDDEVPAGQGVTLRYGRFEGGNWAILRTLGDIDGDGRDDFAYGADANEAVGDGLARAGSAGILRGSVLPQ
ncbi:MAG: FG-GAP repeat protein [Rhodanobacteraceae bacterium]|nr:FG-GAP repeat protein [Rhodanobacteraceae bacterium]